ncbi:hypothetical protein FRC02_008520 [Tulasnella sp. 418]|nr:hypothetical protein FRC02_008520 [Tulasnella sp. 418]
METERVGNDPNLHIPIGPEFGFDSMYWQKYLELAQDQDKDLVANLNVQLDSLLIFAGLFSGINTGFIVLAVTLLTPSASDQTNELLRLLILQTNSTLLETASPPWQLDPISIRITCLFSASLSCGLLASMGAVLGKQWLSYYQRAGQTGSLSDRVFQRQKKFDAIEAYPCYSFLTSLSVLLQLGLLFFLLGLVDYMWGINRAVGWVIISFVCLGLMVYLYTVIAAIRDPHCPFQSPGVTLIRALLLSLRSTILSYLTRHHPRPNKEDEAWLEGNVTPEDARSMLSEVARSVAPSFVDRILRMPFKDLFQDIPLPEEDIVRYSASEKTKEDDELTDRLMVYAKSIRRILESTSTKETLFSAAANIPTIRRDDITRRIFSDPDFSLKDTMAELSRRKLGRASLRSETGGWRLAETIHESRPYVLLVAQLRDSLERYIVQTNNPSKDIVESIVIYGRALCHALISSPEGVEGFDRLAVHLNSFSGLAWVADMSGELGLLLMSILNHPRFWMYLDAPNESWRTINPSALSLYVASVSIVSLAAHASSRDRWVTRMACHSLSACNPTPRMIGLVARSLIHLHAVTPEEMEHTMTNIWHSYSSDVNFVWDVVAALQIYLANVGSVPDSMEAYFSLITAFKGAVEELYKRPDDIYPRARRRRRHKHRRELRSVGSDLLRSLENLVFDLCNRIELLSYPLVHDAESISWYTDPNTLQLFRDQVLFCVSDGVVDQLWGAGLSVCGRTLWKIATTLCGSSGEVLRAVLEMMDRGLECQNDYVDLFQQYPSVADIIVQAITHEDQGVQDRAIRLLSNKAPLWLKEPTSQYFAEAGIDVALASCTKTTDTDGATINKLLRAFEPKQDWKKRLLDAFQNAAMTLNDSTNSQTLMGRMERILETWYELNSWDGVEDSPVDESSQSWLVDGMLALVAKYLSDFVNNHGEGGSIDSSQAASIHVSPAIQAYVTYVMQSISPSDGAVHQEFVEASERWVALISQVSDLSPT